MNIRKDWRSIFKLILYIILFTSIALLAFWRFKIGILRYFDIDEYAHFHWGYSFSIGKKPFADFFYFFPPFFLYLTSLIYKIFGRSINSLIQARVFVYVNFLLLSLVTLYIVKKLRGLFVALLTVFILMFLPLPFDKTLEFRPDIVATLLSFLGLFLAMLAFESKKKYLFFISGFFYSLSLGFVPKTLFFLLPVSIVFLFNIFYRKDRKESEFLAFFLLGFLPGLVIFLSSIIFFGKVPFSLYAMLKLSQDMTKTLARKFYMRPDIFFYPNETYYGIGGYSLPYTYNLSVYVIACLFAIHRFISLFTISSKTNVRTQEFLFVATFFVNLYAFVKIFPLKHAQYLIPTVPFIAFYFADFFTYVFRNKYLSKIKAPAVFIFLILVLFISKRVYERKINWTNQQSLAKIDMMLKTLPKDTSVFDLTGESIFFPDGYYFCCLPYGQYQEVLLFKYPGIEKDFEKRNTMYVYTGNYDRLNVLPIFHANYIRENFDNFYPDGSLLVRKE